MAGALTASSVTSTNLGALNLKIVKFSAVVISDFWESGMTGVITEWANETTAPGTQTSAGVTVRQSSGASGTIIFTPSEDTQDVTLFVLTTD